MRTNDIASPEEADRVDQPADHPDLSEAVQTGQMVHTRACQEEAHLREQVGALQESVATLTREVEAWQRHWTDLERTPGWALVKRLQRLRARLAPPKSKRDQWLERLLRARRSDQLDVAPFQRQLIQVEPVSMQEDISVQAHGQGRVAEGIRARSAVLFERAGYVTRGQARFAGKRVLFLLPVNGAGGGANVIIDEGLAMRAMGVDVRLFNESIYRQAFGQAYPQLQLPIIYGEAGDLGRLGREYDAVIATINTSVAWLKPVALQDGRPVRGYYVQDYEPYMVLAGTSDYQKAQESYTLFADLVRVTKTEWTRHAVQEATGADCRVVGVSINTDLFRPRARLEPDWPARPLRVAAMIRPVTPYRAPKLTMELLKRAVERHEGQVEAVLFGTTLGDTGFTDLPHDFAWKLAGVLSQRQVARLLNEVDVFVDYSSHQAMGLTALEAMACGAAVVVPRQGGAVSFARDGENALVVDTGDEGACWGALERLIEDHALRQRLQHQALVDVCAYYPERAAYNILDTLFPEVHGA
jgi:hypothetical protein